MPVTTIRTKRMLVLRSITKGFFMDQRMVKTLVRCYLQTAIFWVRNMVIVLEYMLSNFMGILWLRGAVSIGGHTMDDITLG
jgi:hypothetical protein